MRLIVINQLPRAPNQFNPQQTARFDQDIERAIGTYLPEIALRLNQVLPKDGTEPMTADLDMDGNDLLNVGTLNQGVYTPVASSATGLTGNATPAATSYLRLGATVFLTGSVNMTPTTAGVTSGCQLTLPFASNFTLVPQASGNVTSINNGVGIANANIANDRLQIGVRGLANGVNADYYFTAAYQIV